MLPQIHDYDRLYARIPLAGARALQHRRRCVRPLGRAGSEPARDPERARGRQDRRASRFGWLRETSNRLANTLVAHGVARGDRVAMLLPQAPEAAAGHIAIYKLGAIAVPLAILFGVDALTYRLQNAGVKAVITNAQGLAKLTEARAALPELSLVLSIDGPGEGALGLHETIARASDRVHAGRHHAGRSRADDLHLRHHRPGEGRAARPSRAARPHAGRRDAARVLPAGRRPVLDAGRLGLGRRPARLPAAEPASRRRRGGAPVREIRSRGSLRAAGENRRAQRLHPADRAAHAALGAKPARAARHQAAHASARAASRSAPRPTSGAAKPSASPSTSSTARPNAIWCCPRAR